MQVYTVGLFTVYPEPKISAKGSKLPHGTVV